MKKVLWNISLVIIFVGVIGLGLGTALGNDVITYIQPERINNIWVYKFDVWGYISEIKNSFDQPNLVLIMPTRHWNNDIINNLAVILNTLIVIANLVIYPLRVGAFTLRTLLVVIGLDVINTPESNPLKWLVDFINTINNMSIPYV